MIMILGFAALVVDLGVLRNNRQILVNTLDSAAMAGASILPVDNATPGHTAADAQALIDGNIQKNYPGLAGYTISYRCLIPVDAAGNPVISTSLPGMCDPHNALGRTPPVYAIASDFTGAGKTRVSACNPALGDRCNVVLVTGSSTTQYALAPVLGVSSGSTGTVVSAACKGTMCGESTVVPVDLVIILDRTGSMAGNDSHGNSKIQGLQTAAKSILGVYDPAKQRVALTLTGPGTVDAAGNPTLNSCPSGGTAYGVADDGNFAPTTTLSGASTTLGSAATTVNAPTTKLGGASTNLSAAVNNSTTTMPVTGKAGFSGTGFTIQIDSEQMTVTANPTGTSWTVQRARNGTTAAAHASGAQVGLVGYLTAAATSITVTSAAGFPTSGNYSILIDTEQMLVTGGQGTTTWTVTRGQGGTTAAAHSSGRTAILVITTASTTIPVAAKTGFPTTYPFTIKIDSEQMSVTGSPSGTLWTVQRGQGGTAAAVHANGAAVSWDVDNADTVIFVASEAGFPTSYPFTIKIDSEDMSVTAAPTSTTWTVTRATDGTTAALHAGGAAVNLIIGKTDTTIRVASAIGFPDPVTVGSQYTILVNSEKMRVISVSGTATPTTVMNVTRGFSSTTAATHTSGTTVINWTSWIPGESVADPSSNTKGVWVPVGLSGTDTDSPLPNPSGANGTYETGGVANPSSTIVKAINCIQSSSNGTTLAMPLAYAKWYLDTYGRPGVAKGILLETDGHPQDGGNFAAGLNLPQFTCTAAIAAAAAAKAEGIKVYAVGYGISGTCGGDSPSNSSEHDAGLTAQQLLQTVASGTAPPYYFDTPDGSLLASYFQQIAINLANGGAHVIQLYPPPVVDSASSGSVSGEYFTGVVNVKFNGADVAFTPVSDTSISITLPGGLTHGQTYPVVVTTPGGSSVITAASQYTYP
jgi:hypothetical protein